MTKKNEQTAVVKDMDEDIEGFATYEAEFTPHIWVSPEESLEMELQRCWSSLFELARKGFKKHGRGYVVISPHCFSGEMEHDACLYDKEAEYVPFKSADSWFSKDDVPDYNPKTELVFAIDFNDGMLKGVVGRPQKGGSA